MTEYKRIHVSVYENVLKTENWRRNWIATNRPEHEVAAHDKRMTERQEKRDAYAKKFPYSVILEGNYPEHDYVFKWCWENFGSPECDTCHDHYSEYPYCPIVLETRVGWHDPNRRADLEDIEVEPHSHEGVWMSFWLGKIGYDYGLSEYFFQNETDRERFLAALPVLQLGE
jgi:hypothetical protein